VLAMGATSSEEEVRGGGGGEERGAREARGEGAVDCTPEEKGEEGREEEEEEAEEESLFETGKRQLAPILLQGVMFPQFSPIATLTKRGTCTYIQL
jgi:hypothetical protein